MRTPPASAFAALALLTAATLAPAARARPVPNKQIPPSVLMELAVVENNFRTALASDCAPERCYLKGCVYQDHITLDQPRGTSLPGLPAEEGPGSVATQEYLTKVLCEFSHEKSVRSSDVKKLATRLESRLSRGWLTVTVTPQALDPIPKSLSESPLDEPPEEPQADETEAEDKPPEPLTFDRALEELWGALVPHTPWMTAIFLLTLATLALIWAGRRLGAPSLEDKLMEAQLANGPPPAAEPEEAPATEAPAEDSESEDLFAQQQEELWKGRLDRIDHDDDDVISRLLREWLKAGEYGMLARALLVFGDRVSAAFDSAPELALKKIEFASYFKDANEEELPSRARFFRDLNQQAMANLLLSQDDTQLVRALREDFGTQGLTSLMHDLPGRYAALLFALSGFEQQQEVAGLLTEEDRVQIASHLLASSRISMAESAYLASCVESVRDGEDMPPPPRSKGSHEHGAAIDSALALSVLLPHMGIMDREGVFTAARQRHGGALPNWVEDIAFNHMLTALPDEVRADLLLEVDPRGLAAWLQMQTPEWRQAFVRELSGPLQAAIAANTITSSRANQLRWAERGHRALVGALKQAYDKKGVRFGDLVA
jgi:hypothetical protein